MPNTIAGRDKYFWIEQIDLEYRQYFDLLKKRKNKKKLKSWLDNKKQMFDSIMEYDYDHKKQNRSFFFSDFWGYNFRRKNIYFNISTSTTPFQLPPTPLLLSILIKNDVPPLSTLIKNDELIVPPLLFHILIKNYLLGLNLTRPHIKRIEYELLNELNKFKHKQENDFINAKRKKHSKRKFYEFQKLNMKGKNSNF